MSMPAREDIGGDPVYAAVAGGFEAMLEPGRYGERSTAFDRIISATHAHFWDPLDPKYIDFDQPFDMEAQAILPEDTVVALSTPYVAEKLSDPRERVRFANRTALHSFSSILHGEQGALNLSASLCHLLSDQGAQEYAANQTREEARHVTAFTRYILRRWGRPLPCGPALKAILVEIVEAPEVYKKIVGMQMLVEGLAMGAFATYYQQLRDPVGRRLMQLVMTDEAFHHKFGRIWAARTVPTLTAREHEVIEDWAAHCFESLLFNLLGPDQQRATYEEFDLDPERVIAEVREVMTHERRRAYMTDEANIFRVLVKTLLHAGIITARTQSFYSAYVDLNELRAEGDVMVGDAIADEGMQYLQAINLAGGSRRSAVQGRG